MPNNPIFPPRAGPGLGVPGPGGAAAISGLGNDRGGFDQTPNEPFGWIRTGPRRAGPEPNPDPGAIKEPQRAPGGKGSSRNGSEPTEIR